MLATLQKPNGTWIEYLLLCRHGFLGSTCPKRMDLDLSFVNHRFVFVRKYFGKPLEGFVLGQSTLGPKWSKSHFETDPGVSGNQTLFYENMEQPTTASQHIPDS